MKNEIKNLIRTKLTFLEDSGFRYREAQRANHVDKTKQQTKFIYEKGHIAVSLELFNTEYWSSLLIFITRHGDNKGFAFEDYLKNLKSYMDITSRKNESETEYLNRMLDRFKLDAQTDLSPVLAGIEWIDVPSDYGR